MFFLSYLLISATGISISNFLILSSDQTPDSLLLKVSTFPQSFKIVSESSVDLITSLSNFDFIMIIDITFTQSYFHLLDTISTYFGVSYLTLTQSSTQTSSPFRYFLHSLYSDEAKGLGKIADYLEWSSFILMSSSQKKSLEISNYVNQNLQERVFSYLKYEENLSQELADNLIMKMIKAKGIRKLLVVDQDESFEKIQDSIHRKNLSKIGSTFVFSSRTIYSANVDGALVVVESGCETAKTKDEYEYFSITSTIAEIDQELQASGVTSATSELLSQILQERYPNHVKQNGYVIVNIHDGVQKIVGKIGEDLEISAEIYYPGNTTSSQASESTKLTFSIANGTSEIYDIGYSNSLSYFYLGANYAVSRSNTYNDIPRFTIELFPTDCGIYLFDEFWYTYCLSLVQKNLGIAYLTSFWYASAYGNAIALQNLGLKIPQISPFGQDESINNKTEFPEILKLSVSSSEFYSTGFLFQKALNWYSVNVIATDDSVYMDQYNSVLEYSYAAGIKIVNPESARIFPWNYTRNDFEAYRSYFQAAKDTECRIFIIIVWDKGPIIEGFYDIGLREGDFISIGDTYTLSILSGVEEKYLKKREELMSGSLVVSYKEWNGDLGKQLYSELSQIYPSVPLMCLTYDTVSVVKEAIIYMLAKGDDYEDTSRLEYTMRTNKLTGCLGTIYFNTDDNSRASAQFSFQQLRKNLTTQTWNLIDVVYLDKYSPQLITSVSTLIWPLNNLTTPDNFRPENLCPFDNYQIVGSQVGKILAFMFALIFIIFSIILSTISTRNYPKDFVEMRENKLISFDDMIYSSFFVFQFFQIINLGPEQAAIRNLFNNFQMLLSMDFIGFFQLTTEKFWRLYIFVLVLVMVWIIPCFYMFFQLRRMGRSQETSWLKNFIKESVFPIIGHIAFVPIFSILMDIYVCKDGISKDLTGSYLNIDCSLFCYQGIHKTYIVLSTFCIFAYLTTAIFLRPFWETCQFSLNLKTKPIYLSFLSIFQVIAVGLEKTLSTVDQNWHGAALSFLIIFFLILTFFLKPYNNKRSSLFQYLSLLLAFWGVFTSTVFRNYSDSKIWAVVELVGFAVILVIGLLIRDKFPTFLYSEKGKDIAKLFKSQFGITEEVETKAKDFTDRDISGNINRTVPA